MSAKRIKLVEVIDRINDKITHTEDENAKATLCDLAADLLHDHGVYGGFMYTFWTDEVMAQYESIHDAMADGCGTEFDRQYFTYHIRF